MNQLETNLALWAICSILLFEILIIICLCRCCFNRIRPKKFYVKREEYQCLEDIDGGTRSKFPSTILRPPHADELALVGTVRGQRSIGTYKDGFQNAAFSPDYENERIPRVQPSSWIELQPNVIQTAHLPPADYEVRAYLAGDYYYTHPRPSNHDESSDGTSDFTNYHLQPLRRPELILPQLPRIDTSTEFYGARSSSTIPKSILKSGISTTPPPDIMNSSYSQPARSRTSSKSDHSPSAPVRMITDRSFSITDKEVASPTLALPPKYRMQFASMGELNDVEWEVPREFQTIARDYHPLGSNHSRSPPNIVDAKPQRPWQDEFNLPRPYPSWRDESTQQQAFEY